jgi:1,2-diacylglycerol 3-beta-glucosyltransferase
VGVLGTAAFVGGLAALAAASYLVALAVAALFYRVPPDHPAQASIAVLVPAHDEELLIGRTVTSLLGQSYPRELYRVVVIADNCRDRTASIAIGLGVDVLVRDDLEHRGKGQAISWAIAQLATDGGARPDAFVIVDADSEADPNLLRALAGSLAGGADVVQADYMPMPEGESSPSEELRRAALLLFNRARSQGRQVLHLPATLLGNGMLFSRRALELVPWSAFSSTEDLEFGIVLRLHRIRPRYAGGAGVVGAPPGTLRAATTQRLRWEGGRLHVLRTYGLRLLGHGILRRDPSLLDAAADLLVPPLALLALLAAAGALITSASAAVGVAPWLVAAPWDLATAALVAYVIVGLRAGGAPATSYRALAQAPAYVLWKLGVYARMLRGVDPHRWVRTARGAGDAEAG